MRNITRYSLAFVLFVVTLVAGYFGGMQQGFDKGRDEWMALPTFTKTYSVQTIVLSTLNNQESSSLSGSVTAKSFEPIVDDVKENVMPHVWENDPKTQIQPYPARLSIIVTGNATIHHEIERYLAIEKLNAEKQIVGYRNPKDGG